MWPVPTTRIGFRTWIWSKRHWEWGRKWLVDVSAEKTQLVNLIGLITLVLLMSKWMGLFSWKNDLLRCWCWLSLLNCIGTLIILSLLLKLPPGKLEPWFILWRFFLLRLFYISINLPYGHAWNTVVMSGLVLLVAAWKC